MERTEDTWRFRPYGALATSIALLGLVAAGGAEAADKLERAYGEWVVRHEALGADRNVVLALGWSKAYSPAFSRATGSATLDLVERRIDVQVRGLGARLGDVWVVDNAPGDSAAPGPGDDMVLLGRLERAQSAAVLVADLPLDASFDVDLVVVTQPGGSPEDAGVLFGSPGLWQRRYTEERQGRGRRKRPDDPTALRVASLDPLVQRGAELFFDETFDGNGRTCGTCHPGASNLTIDPEFIATLPDDDPLFVAEFVPALERNFEKPALMRQLGLILENTNGFERPETNFTMRGVPHTLGMSVSIAASAGFPVEQATGWSGDGAPNGGSLRQFANGAIRQHFPLSTERIEDRDFRFASEEELDALELFQLFLGRDTDPDITPGSETELHFRSPLVERGKELFNDSDTSDGAAGKCASCHSNAGANAAFSGTNDNFDTGVEDLPDAPADLIVAEVGDPDLALNPDDDGLGSPGDDTFNTPSLVEAADTGPFFHNNAAATLEEAVDFYNSAAFAASPAGQFLASPASGEMNGIAIQLDPEQVVAVGAFLRVLNALENIRSAAESADFARGLRSPRSVRNLVQLAAADVADAEQVLAAARLHPDTRRRLRAAGRILVRAGSGRAARRDARLDSALRKMESARQSLLAR